MANLNLDVPENFFKEEVRNGYKISASMKKVWAVELDLLNEFAKVCKKHDIRFFAAGGTLLGAVRHKGFIPWDDDVDVCMPREDYNKIFSILQKTFENDKNFYLRERDLKDNNFQIRIRHRQINIGLDIFPVDCYYKSDLTEKEKEEANKKISLALKILNKKYKRRKKLNIEKIHKAKKDIIKIQKEIILDNKTCSSEYPALFFGIDYPSNAKSLIFNNNIVFPLKEILFEGEFYSSPNNTDEYLKNFYTDYMKFPEHFCY